MSDLRRFRPHDYLARVLLRQILQSPQEEIGHSTEPAVIRFRPWCKQKPHFARPRGAARFHQRPLGAQLACRPQQRCRGCAGDVPSGLVRPGMPAGIKSPQVSPRRQDDADVQDRSLS
jgi:hypothetical protein